MSVVLDYIKSKKLFLIITSILIASNIWIWFFIEPNKQEPTTPKQNPEIDYSDSSNIA